MGGDEKGRGHHGSSRKHERDKHGEEEKITSAKKRRWSDSEAVDGTPNVLKPKQVSAEVVADLVSKDAELRQLCQSQIRQLYLHLATLTDFSNSASGPSSNEGEQLKAFQALLEASQGGCGARRLAARLVPRFLARFPHLADAASSALLAMHRGDMRGPVPSGPGSVLHNMEVGALGAATRWDALRGLGVVLGVCVRLADRAVTTVLKVVEHLLRQLGTLTSTPEGGAALLAALATQAAEAAEAAASTQGGHVLATAPDGCGVVRPQSLPHSHKEEGEIQKLQDPLLPRTHPCQDQPPATNSRATSAGLPTTVRLPPGTADRVQRLGLLDGAPQGEGEEGVEVCRLLEQATRGFPRVVLTSCLQAFKGSDTAAYAGARWFCGHVLLAERRPPPPATQPAGTDGQAVGSVAAGTRDGRGAEEAGGRVGAGAAAPKACAPGGELGRVVVVKTEEEGGGAGGADAGAGAMQATAGAVGEQPQQSEPMQQQQQQSQCLAGEILSQLPDTQQWLRQAISAIMKDKKVVAAKDVHAHIDRLLRLAAPPPAPQPPPPPPAVAAATEDGGGGAGGEGGVPVKSPTRPGAVEDGRRAGRVRGFSLTVDGAEGLTPQRPTSPAATDAARPTHATSSAADVTPPPPPPPPPPPAPTPDPHTTSGGAAPNPSSASQSPPLTPVVCRGGGLVTRADCCLWLGCLPPALSDAALAAECGRHGTVSSTHCGPPAGLPVGEALVVFASVQDAALCAEALAGERPFGGSRALAVEFCAGLPADCPMRAKDPSRPASAYVWCGVGVPPEELVGAVGGARLPGPRRLLRVGRHMPGFLLDMPTPCSAGPVADLLISLFMPTAHSANPLPPPPPSHTTPYGHTVPHTTPTPASALPPPPLPPPPHGGVGGVGVGGEVVAHPTWRTLWVGQVAEGVSDQELLAAFSRYGQVVSHRLLRGSHCAFIDFLAHTAAADARRALNGARLGGQALRVEWKMENRPGMAPPASLPLPPPPHLAHPHTTPGYHPPLPHPSPYPTTHAHHHSATPGGGSAAVPPALSLQHVESGSVPLGGSHTPSHPPHTPHTYSLTTPAPRRLASPSHPMASLTTPTPRGSGATGAPSPMFPTQTPTSHPQHQPLTPALTFGGVQGSHVGVLARRSSAGGAGQNVWQGMLAKSGVPLCAVCCAAAELGGGSTGVPRGWPGTLDVRMRVEVTHVTHTVWASTPGASRGVWRLTAPSSQGASSQESTGASAKLAEFAAYLRDKRRAGVVRIEGGHAHHNLYLVPPSPSTCADLGVTFEPRRDAVVLLAVEVAGTAGIAHHGAGGGGR